MATKGGSNTEMAIILRALKRRGYKTVPAGSGHRKVVDEHGRPVVDSNGPLIISSSPSDNRWRAMTINRLMKANVLKEDPFEDSPKGKGTRLTDPDVQAKKLAAIQARAVAERTATTKLREFLEPFIVMIGGWEKHAQIPLVAKVAMAYLDKVKHGGRWKTHDAAMQSLRNLKAGNTLSDAARKNWTRFFDELASDSDPLVRWNELHREALGIGWADAELGDEPDDEQPTPAEQAVEAFIQQQRSEISTGAGRPLALEALYYMARGADDKETVFALYERIAALEGR